MERKLGTAVTAHQVYRLFNNHAKMIETYSYRVKDDQMRTIILDRVKSEFPSGATIAEVMPLVDEIYPGHSYNYQTLRLLLKKHNLYKTIRMEP